MAIEINKPPEFNFWKDVMIPLLLFVMVMIGLAYLNKIL